MRNNQKWAAWLGAGAVVITLAGCGGSDTPPDTAPPGVPPAGVPKAPGVPGVPGVPGAPGMPGAPVHHAAGTAAAGAAAVVKAPGDMIGKATVATTGNAKTADHLLGGGGVLHPDATTNMGAGAPGGHMAGAPGAHPGGHMAGAHPGAPAGAGHMAPAPKAP